MSNPLSIAYLPTLKRWEGSVPWMYRDSRGYVTCGIGFMLPSATAACAFPFFGLHGVTATESEITAAYDQVAQMQEGRLPSFYDYYGALQLPQDWIDTHAASELDILVDTLDKGISGFYGMRQEWKMALLDLAYNLGASGLLKGYPQLLAAVEHGNGHLAAQQCHRIGVSEDRNSWCEQQFLAVK
jgi:GH24 family phage-related lysozyme (muramidase)